MIRINPILRNEMKTDSRRFRFYLLLMLYVVLIGLPVLIFYHVVSKAYRIDASSFSGMYVFLACMQAVILMFIAPALTANAITSEREKQTLDILLTTQMTPRSIIWGKLLAAISKVILLIICVMPIYAVVLFLGGIRLSHIIGINLYLMATTVCVGALCIWISTVVKTSKFANVAAYFMELGFIVGVPVVVCICFALNMNRYDGKAVEEMMKVIMHIICVSPAVGYGHLIGGQLFGGNIMDYMYMFDVSGKMIVPGWVISIGVEVVLTILFMELAVRGLNPLKKPSKIRGLFGKRKNKKAKKSKEEVVSP
ncbi:MAG: ABC transporter permease subunit [Cellulosilyticum sp.]|nr:ABC transporter permease subunit [Cellulosilyticum sp.]